MGYEAACAITVDGRRFRGTAHLESTELVVRGETRLTIRIDQVKEVAADHGRLLVRFAGSEATFEIGAEAAAKWAARIANPPSRIAKLGVKPGTTVAILDVDDDRLVSEVEGAGGSIVSAARSGSLDTIFVGVETPGDLRRLETLRSRLSPAGAIWVIRAKGKAATISEAESMAAAKEAGLVDVKVVSFSETHSAEKYVIPRAARPAATRARPDRPASPRSRTSGSPRPRVRR